MPEVMELIGVVPAPDWGAWEPAALCLLTAGAAALILACLAFLGGGREARLARPFSLAALAAGLTGQAALFVSLEQPFRAYEFFLHPAFSSWTAVGAYVVPLFLLTALLLALGTRNARPIGRLAAALALLPGIAVFVYATNEIMACVGRALWTNPALPLLFVIAGLAGGIGLAACLSGESRPAASEQADSPARLLAGLATLAVAACTVMAALLPAPAGFGRAVSLWWHAPDVLCLLATFVAVADWRRARRSVLAAGLAGLAGGFLLFWKLIQMGQAFPRNAATVADKAAFLDLLSGPSLLALAGSAGLLLGLSLLLPMLLPAKPLSAPQGVR